MVLLARMKENTDVPDTLGKRSSAGTKRYQKTLYYLTQAGDLLCPYEQMRFFHFYVADW